MSGCAGRDDRLSPSDTWSGVFVSRGTRLRGASGEEVVPVPEPLLALLAILGILAPVGLALWALARSSQRSLEELQQGGPKAAPAGEQGDSGEGPTEPEPEADEGPDPGDAVPLLEAWFAWLDVPTLEELQRGDPGEHEPTQRQAILLGCPPTLPPAAPG